MFAAPAICSDDMSADGLRMISTLSMSFRRNAIDSKHTVVAATRHLLTIDLDLGVDRWQTAQL